MKKEYWVLSIFMMFFLVASLFLYNYGYKGNESLLISGTGVVITLFIGFYNYQIADERMFMDLFQSFNERYNEKLNDFFDDLKKNPNKSIESETNLVIDYFNLCSEEYLWYKKNRIPKSVWKAWKAGMIENIELPKVKELFLSETSTATKRKSYYGLAEELGYYKK